MDKPDYRELARDLSKNASDLIANILEKHDAAILEEMHSQLKIRDNEVKRLKQTVGKLTAWLANELGQEAAEKIIEELN